VAGSCKYGDEPAGSEAMELVMKRVYQTNSMQQNPSEANCTLIL
jgi:hypothetical protein